MAEGGRKIMGEEDGLMRQKVMTAFGRKRDGDNVLTAGRSGWNRTFRPVCDIYLTLGQSSSSSSLVF